jgi:hypothetical protein
MSENPDQSKYEMKIQYGTGIQSRIAKVHNAIENGKDSSSEFRNLLAYLHSEILNPIKPELSNISKKYAERVQNINKMTVFPETTYKWSGRHKTQYISALINREQNYAINEMLPILINRLENMGLLGEKTRQTRI